jgi:hypothetical protein
MKSCFLIASLTIPFLFLHCSTRNAWEEPDRRYLKENIPHAKSLIESVNRQQAQDTVRYFVSQWKFKGAHPNNTPFELFFFHPKDIGNRFQFKDYHDMELSTPAQMSVVFDNGLNLLFCFNKMIINVNESLTKECPLGFSSAPLPKKLEKQHENHKRTDRVKDSVDVSNMSQHDAPSHSKQLSDTEIHNTGTNKTPSTTNSKLDKLLIQRNYIPLQWPISELPGVKVGDIVESQIFWPPRSYLDSEGIVDVSDGNAAIASVPIVNTKGACLGWVALLVHKSEEYPSKIGLGLLKSKTVKLVRILKGQKEETLFEFEHIKDEDDPSVISSTRIQKMISLKITNDRLLTLSYPKVSRYEDETENGTAISVETTHVQYRNLGDKAADKIDLTDIQCQDIELRDVDGEGKPEYFCISTYQLVEVKDRNGQLTRCPAAFRRPNRIYLEIERNDKTDTWSLSKLARQPAFFALIQFAQQIENKSPHAFEVFGDALSLNAGLNKSIVNREKDEEPGGKIFSEELQAAQYIIEKRVTSLLRKNTSNLDTWRCLASMGQENTDNIDNVAITSLKFSAISKKVDAIKGRVQWKDDNTLLLMEPDTIETCTLDKCDQSKEKSSIEPIGLSPEKKRLAVGVAARKGAVTLFVLTDKSKSFSDMEMLEYAAQDLCVGISEIPGFDNKDDDTKYGELVPTFSGVTGDGFENKCDSCCIPDNALHGGHGIVGWINSDSIIYATAGDFHSLSLKERRSFPLRVEDIPDSLLPFSGVTKDRRYRFFIDKRFGLTTLWRIDLKNREAKMLVNPSQTETDMEKFGIDPYQSTGKPLTALIPSPNGKRVAVVVGGQVANILELRNDMAHIEH